MSLFWQTYRNIWNQRYQKNETVTDSLIFVDLAEHWENPDSCRGVAADDTSLL